MRFVITYVMHKMKADPFKILLNLASLFSVSPSYEYVNKDKSPALIFRIYGLAMPVVIIVAYGVCLDGTIKYRYKKFHVEAVGVVIDSMTTFLFGSLAVITTLSPALQCQTWRNFFRILEDVTKTMNCPRTARNATRNLKIQLFIIHALFLLIYFWNISVWTYFIGIQTSKYYIFRHSTEYVPFLSTILMVNLSRTIRHRYRFLNNTVKQPAVWAIKRNFKNDKSKQLLWFSNSRESEETIRNIQRNYRKMGKLVNLFNSLFGYQILLLIAMTIITLLESLESAIREDSIIILLWSSITTTFFFVSLIVMFCFAY